MRCRQCGWPWVKQDDLCENCLILKDAPNELSSRKELAGVPFKDMKQMDETERVQFIISHIKNNPGHNILVMVDTGEGHADKGDRYIKAIREKLPSVKVVSRRPGPIDAVESISFRL